MSGWRESVGSDIRIGETGSDRNEKDDVIFLARPASEDGIGGILAIALDLMTVLGEWGVGLFTLIETVFPPVPSEVILPLAGYLSTAGGFSIPLLLFTSVLGAYLGALLLYWLGSAFGLERSIAALSRLPLVEREDFERASDWFARHGRAAIFFGRLIPGVRSLISLPAGAQRMNLLTFSVFTIAGSTVWNSLLIGFGAALGTQYQLVAEYSRYLNYAVAAALLGLLAWLVIRHERRRRGARRQRE